MTTPEGKSPPTVHPRMSGYTNWEKSRGLSRTDRRRFWVSDFETAQQYAMRGLQIWRSGGASSRFEEVDSQPVACLCHQAIFEWHFGEIVSCQATMAESSSLAKDLNDMHGLAVALYCSTFLAYFEGNAAEVEHLSSDLIQLSTRHTFSYFLTVGILLRGWARSVSGNAVEGIMLIEDATKDYRAKFI
jgi:hypothetical protein